MHSRTSETPFITTRGYRRDVVEQLVNYFLLHYKNVCSYKGIIMHMRYRDFVKG